jgi:PAS domain S-box-containing protein
MSIAFPRSVRSLFRNIPLRWVFTIPFLLPTITAVSAVGYFSYRSGQVAVNTLGEQLVLANNDRITQELKNYLQPSALINRLNVDAVQQGQLDLNNTSELEAFLYQRLQQFTQVSGVLFVDPEGRLRLVDQLPELYLVSADPPNPTELSIYRINEDGSQGELVTTQSGLDIRSDRPWYQRAVNTRQAGWSPISQYGSLEFLTLDAFHPVYDRTTQELLGVFAVHVRLDYLSEFLRGLDISRRGRVIIVDQNGMIIATSTQEQPYRFTDGIGYERQFERLPLEASQDEVTRSLAAYLRRHPTQLTDLQTSSRFNFYHSGELQLAKITPFTDPHGLNWRIITVLPKSFLLGAIQQNIRTTALLCLLTLGAAIVIGLILTNKLIARFTNISRVSREFAAGNLNQRLPTNSIVAELNGVAHAFNQMADQVQQSFDRIQTALATSEEKFATVFRSSPNPLIIASLSEGRILDSNDSLSQLFGYSHAEIIGRTTLELNLWENSEDRDHYRNLLQQQGNVRNLEIKLRTKAGEVRTVVVSTEVRTLEGQACGITVLQDITDRKAAEIALQQSEERFQEIAQTINQIFYVLSAITGQYLYVSPAFERIWGDSCESLFQDPRGWLNRVHPDDQPIVLEVLDRLYSGDKFYFEYRIIRADGAIRWIAADSLIIKDENGTPLRIIGLVEDITDRKAAEISLQRYERIVSATTDAISLVDRHYCYQLVNQTYLDWHQKDYHDIVGHSVAKLNGSEVFETVIRPHLDRCLSGETIQYSEWFEVPALGRQFLNITYSPYFELNHSISGAVVSVRNITLLKQAEQALQEREAMLRAIGDNLPKGFIYQRVYEPGKGSYYSYISAGVERLLGLKPEMILADPKTIRSVGFEEELAHADQIIQESLQHLTPIELQMRNRTATGEIQWSSIRSTPRRLADGRTVWDGVEVDITDLKRTEAALRASEELLRNAFDYSPIGISLVSITGEYIKVNPYYCNLLGYTKTELLSMKFQDITHPDDLETDLKGFQKMMAGEIQSFQLEKRYISKQGNIIPVLMNAALIRDQNEEPLYCVGQVQDIRARLEVERMKDEFISIVSHELRTPLTSIRGALGILGSGVFNDRPEQAQQMLKIAINNSDRLVRLVNDILSLERLTSGKVQLVMEECQVVDLMQQAVNAVQAIADQADITLSLTPLSATVWAAPDALTQTLINLLGNAIKFSPSHSTIWLRADKIDGNTEKHETPQSTSDSLPLATSTASLPTSYLLFSIQDQGRGIPEDKQETIFEQFQQVDLSDSREKGGTGLGLVICKNIVQQHGGKIWVESQLGVGSTFYFTLPLTRKQHEQTNSDCG